MRKRPALTPRPSRLLTSILLSDCSSCPRERCVVPVFPCVGEIKTERAHPRGGRLCYGQGRISRMENPCYLGNLPLRSLWWHEVNDFYLREFPYAHPVAAPIILVFDGGPHHAQHLPHQRDE